MDNEAILREEIARGFEATKTKTVLQIYFDKRRTALQEAIINVKPDELPRLQAALIELQNLEIYLNDLEAGGKMASKQLDQANSLN